MADTTDEQVRRARERVDRLNAEIASERAKQAAAATENINDLRVTQLSAEGDRLQNELDTLRRANAQASNVVEQVTAQAAVGTTFGGPTTAGDADGSDAADLADDDK